MNKGVPTVIWGVLLLRCRCLTFGEYWWVGGVTAVLGGVLLPGMGVSAPDPAGGVTDPPPMRSDLMSGRLRLLLDKTYNLK